LDRYGDEKCFKIFTNAGLIGYDDAEKFCSNEEDGSTLISI
jgi:hypothetical protein